MKWLCAIGDFGGAYSSLLNLFTYTLGPTVAMQKHSVKLFTHALFGGAHAGRIGSEGGTAMMFAGA